MSREYEIHLIKEKVKELEGNVFPITHFAEKNGEGVLICLPFTPAILAVVKYQNDLFLQEESTFVKEMLAKGHPATVIFGKVGVENFFDHLDWWYTGNCALEPDDAIPLHNFIKWEYGLGYKGY